MKTPDEIKKDALALIRQTNASYRQLSKDLCGKENATLEELLHGASQVKADLEAVKRERDAAVRDCGRFPCQTCEERENRDLCLMCAVVNGSRRSLHQWRGVCPENTEVQEDDH